MNCRSSEQDLRAPLLRLEPASVGVAGSQFWTVSGFAVRQHIDNSASFEITDDRAVALTALPGEAVDTEDKLRWSWDGAAARRSACDMHQRDLMLRRLVEGPDGLLCGLQQHFASLLLEVRLCLR